MNELGLSKIIYLRGFNIVNNVIRMKKKKKIHEAIDDSAGHFASSI